jgi:hypothetical protein
LHTRETDIFPGSKEDSPQSPPARHAEQSQKRENKADEEFHEKLKPAPTLSVSVEKQKWRLPRSCLGYFRDSNPLNVFKGKQGFVGLPGMWNKERVSGPG